MDSLRKKQHRVVRPSASAQGMLVDFSILLFVCLLLATAGCAGSGSNQTASNSPLAGNWQFNMTPPSDGSFTGDPHGASANSVLQGGFLVQNNGSITGQAVFSIWVIPNVGAPPAECNGGTATITGMVSAQTVSLTATVGSLDQNGNPTMQTFTLSGQLSADNSTIQGNYSSTAGFYYPQGSTTLSSCGGAESGVDWSANFVPSITGTFQGFFHSFGASDSNSSQLAGQVFPVTGSLVQGQNIGASSATVMGSLVFTGYPCMSKATINGVISGGSVILQIFNASTGADAGQIGGWPGTPVTYDNTSSGYVLHAIPSGTSSPIAYALATSSCPLPSGATLSTSISGDEGSVCLAFGAPNSATGVTACSAPITVSPASVTFAPQLLASGSRTRQVLTITNNQAAGSSPLTVGVQINEFDSDLIYTSGGGDFNGLPNFTEQNTCGSGIAPQQSCTVSISFAPQQSCPWIPGGSNPNGLAPAKCPGLFNPLVPPKNLLAASLIVTVPNGNPDGDGTYSIPLQGVGLSALVPSPAELDFGAEDPNLGEMSAPQTVSFTNQSTNPVQILNSLPGFAQTCNSAMASPFQLARPPIQASTQLVPGLLIAATNGATGSSGIVPFPSAPPTVEYYCDFVQTSGSSYASSFQITADACSGMVLNPGQTCNVTIVYAPQALSLLNFPDPAINGGLDYFLQLNTLQCDLNDSPPQPPPSQSNPCEIDSGRFPVEITANPPGPLRMSPTAGLEFGTWLRGASSTPMTVTLTNDQAENQTVTFTGNALTGTDYLESNNSCPAILSPGGSCQLTFTFIPSVSGFDSSTLTIGYNITSSSGTTTYNNTQYIYLRGYGQ